MNNKTLSIVSYITFIGWLIAYFSGKENANGLLKYHLKQSFGLFLAALAFNILVSILAVISVSLASIVSIAGIGFLILTIIGIINAANELEKPLPIIGKMLEDKFSFVG